MSRPDVMRAEINLPEHRYHNMAVLTTSGHHRCLFPRSKRLHEHDNNEASSLDVKTPVGKDQTLDLILNNSKFWEGHFEQPLYCRLVLRRTSKSIQLG
jgi:hypothetical protein